MPTLLFKDLGLVKGVGFDSWRRVGSVMQAVKVYNLRDVDELVFLDVTATIEARPPDFETVDDIADECFMPLTVGGGIRTVEHVRRLLEVGADKVALCTALVEVPELVTAVADTFGRQCVVASIDARPRDEGWEAFVRCGTRDTGRDAVELAREAEALGAGEILLTAVERDGTMLGYDVELTRRVCDAVTIPVIASGGAGGASDMAAVLEAGASAAAAASIFHFTEQTPLEMKRDLAARGFPVRL
jgi:cyclase